MLKSNNKFTSALKSIAIVLALVAVLVMSLAGCTDEDARQMAQDAANKANAAVTQTQLNDAVTAALADYAKKTDVMTQDGVASAITEALKDYAKTADSMTEAQVETAIKTALATYTDTDVNALINKVKTEIEDKMTKQSDDLKIYADGKIDTETWNKLTGTYEDLDNPNTVIGACKAVDKILAEVIANEAVYTEEDYALAVALCEAAKVRYIRATTLGDLNVDELEEQIKNIPTIASEALAVAGLMAKIPVPMTTAQADQEALVAAEEAFKTWCDEYEATAEIFKTKLADSDYDGEKLLGTMAYARNKLDNILVPAYKTINTKICDYLATKSITFADGYVKGSSEADATVKAEDIIGSFEVLIGDEVALDEIFTLREAFIGDTDDLADYALDDNDNNGDADNRFPYWDVIVDCLDKLNEAKFNEAKTLLIAEINGEMKEIVNTLKVATDSMQNDVLRNAIADLEHQVVSYITENLKYALATYTYTTEDNKTATYKQVYAKAAAHIEAVKTALTNEDGAADGVLQALVDGFYANITAGDTYKVANAKLGDAVKATMETVKAVVAYSAN